MVDSIEIDGTRMIRLRRAEERIISLKVVSTMKNDLISKKELIEALENWCGKQRYLIPEEVWNIIQAAPVVDDKE